MGTDLSHTPVVGGEVGYPDMLATPDLSTLIELPWEPDVASCLADLTRDGDPEPTDVRGLVRRAEAGLEELGMTAKVGPELEFFVCEPDGNGGWRRHVDNLSMVYTVGPQADPQNVLKGLLAGISAMGIGAIAANHEFMNSQYEINLSEAAPLQAADAAFRFKAAVKDYVAQRGLHATFMGKPFNDQGGSGMHLHLSLEREGENCFDDPEGEDGLAPSLRHFAAGVLAHAPALMAFLNPTINAYRRITPDSLAPTHVNWGLDNRTTFIRIPPERGGGCRIEIRVADGAANAHLITAAVIFAGLDGIRNELEPPRRPGRRRLRGGPRAAGRAAADVPRCRPRRARGRRGDPRGSRRRDRRHVPRDQALRGRPLPPAHLRLGDRGVPPPPLMLLDDVDLNDHSRFAERVPHEMFATLRSEDPVHWQDEPDGRGYWAVTRHPDIIAVAKDWRTFSSERGGTSLQDLEPAELEARKSMIDMDPPPHNKLRAIVNRDFTPRAVRRLRGAHPLDLRRDPRRRAREGRARLRRRGRGGAADADLRRDARRA